MNTKGQSPNFMEVFNLYYRAGFPSLVGSTANSIALAILYKWNVLIRPAEFTMSNLELQSLSGVNTHLERSRQILLDRCKLGGIPLITYIPGTTRQAGKYKINSTLTPDYRQINSTLPPDYSQKQPQNGNIPKEKKRKEKNNNNTGNNEQDPYLRLLEYKPGILSLGKTEHKEMLEFIKDQPIERVEYAVKWSKEANEGKGVPAIAVLKFVYRCLDNYDYSFKRNEPDLSKQQEKAARKLGECKEVMFEDAEHGKGTKVYGCIKYLARHTDRSEDQVYSDYRSCLPKSLEYYKSIWIDPGEEAIE